MKVATAEDYSALLRKYSVVLIGDIGFDKANAKFLKDAGLKSLPPTKKQKEVLAHLIHLNAFIAATRATIEATTEGTSIGASE